MYKKLVRTYYIVINPFRKLYWFIFRPKTKGVKCVIEHQGHILLVRLGYAHKKWTIPGGGVKRNETWEQAIRREVFEEVGIQLNETEKVAEYTQELEYKKDSVVVFHANVPSFDFKIDGIEITEAQWFLPKDFPDDCVPRVKILFQGLMNRP